MPKYWLVLLRELDRIPIRFANFWNEDFTRLFHLFRASTTINTHIYEKFTKNDPNDIHSIAICSVFCAQLWAESIINYIFNLFVTTAASHAFHCTTLFFAYKNCHIWTASIFVAAFFSAFVSNELVKLVSHDTKKKTRSIRKRYAEWNSSYLYFCTSKKSYKCEVSCVGDSPGDKADNINNIYQ